MKVLIAIPSCHENFQKVEDQRQTWLPTTEYRVFLGTAKSRYFPRSDEVVLPCKDDYLSLPFKIREICKWAVENDYDFLWKIDDDVYLFPERLKKIEIENVDYVGNFGGSFYAGGHIYGLSKKLMQRIIQHPAIEGPEDMYIGLIAAKYKEADKLEYLDIKAFSLLFMIFSPQWKKTLNLYLREHNLAYNDIISICSISSNLPLREVHSAFMNKEFPLKEEIQYNNIGNFKVKNFKMVVENIHE